LSANVRRIGNNRIELLWIKEVVSVIEGNGQEILSLEGAWYAGSRFVQGFKVQVVSRNSRTRKFFEESCEEFPVATSRIKHARRKCLADGSYLPGNKLCEQRWGVMGSRCLAL
jgi:hypothetical protein